MKTIKLFIIPVILIALLTNPVLGFAGMAKNTSGGNTGNITLNENIDIANATQSDQDIEISSHLIELDADRYESQNKLYVRETIVFRNTGTKIFSGTLKTWVPGGLGEIKVMKAQMVAETGGQPIVTVQKENIISWGDVIKPNSFDMYVIEYLLSAEPRGTITKSRYYSKKLLYPTQINYEYSPSPGYPVFILKVTKSRDNSITLLDENRNKIIAEDASVEDNSIIDRFFQIRFKEINIEISKTSFDLSQYAIYLIIGLLIVLVLAYPVIRKKSNKIQEIEEKVRNSLKREPAIEEEQETVEEHSQEEPEEGSQEEVPEEAEEEPAPEDEELTGKTDDELDVEKRELVTKLKELEKDYASGNLIDEEYEEVRNSYREKLNKLKHR